MVFIIPGMENFAPERTLTSSGFVGSPNFFPICFFELRRGLQYLLIDLIWNLVPVLEVDVTDFGRDRESGRHRHPGAAISASPAPLPPRTSFIFPSPSAVPPPKL